MNELQKLITAMLDEQLTEDEFKRLEALLKKDPEARRAYIEQCQLHASLSLDPQCREALKAKAPIDLEIEDETAASSEERSWLRRAASQIVVMSASVAISAAGIIAVLRLSNHSDTPKNTSMHVETSPEKAYEQAAFPDEGSLKRPPTNFAAISPDHSEDQLVSFNRDIRPILSDNCYHCHGPDASTRKAELRLDIEANAFSPHGEYEAAIIPGDALNSPLYKRIINPFKSEVMPPPDSHKVLSQSDKDLIRDWIDQGAKWEEHWAFIKPKKTAPPKSDWGNGAIDAFIAAKHKELGLKPNRPADRVTLARRLALDLTGLPPSPELVEHFVSDDSPNAYERLVDTLLSDAAYGEHQARYWLDAARYADTHGLHFDNYREIWPYRDWVVKAFNENKPFDAFTLEQIAGDLLPNSSIDQRLATGFNRCNPTTSEGGVIEEEYKAIYAKDRVETTATVYLGLTMGCASCHDHKFDPLSQEDFYRFAAFFNNLNGPILDGNAKDTKPVLVLPPAEYEAIWPELSQRFEASSQRLNQAKEEAKTRLEEWIEAEDSVFLKDTFVEDFVLTLKPKEAEGNEDKESKPESRSDMEFEAGMPIDLPEQYADLGLDKPFTLLVDYHSKTLGKGDEELILSKFDGDKGFRMYLLYGDSRLPDFYRIRFEAIRSLKKGDLVSTTTASVGNYFLRPNQRSVITVSYDGSGKASGFSLMGNSRIPIDANTIIDNLTGEFSTNAPLVIGHADTGDDSDQGATKRIAIFDERKFSYEINKYNNRERLEKLIGKSVEERSKQEKSQIEKYYYDIVDSVTAPLRKAHAIIESDYFNAYDHMTISLVMEEKNEPAFAYILERGEYDKKGEKVSPAIPSLFGSIPAEAPQNRLDLARWLISPDNPLTARVTVNRFWQNLFGTGLVKTSEDFGIMGENPSHPEMLDWLAVDFQERDWDVKAMIKQIVMSETYRQDTRISKEAYESDPDNRYLARGARYRLDAETIRDQALAVSGVLVDTMGGPPVKPYQPDGIWKAVGYPRSDTRHYEKDTGEALYRRSLYTFWKRTAPPPNMAIFDAPSRESCSVRRERTNTPLQALTLMNDPQYVEAARLLAQRVALDRKESVETKIATMYRFAFGAEAPAKHRDALYRSFERFKENFSRNPQDARSLIQAGDSVLPQTGDAITQASLTMVASQIMNLDSFLNKN